MTFIYGSLNEHEFKSSVDAALKSVERILDVHRNPRLAEDVDHTYWNKYDLTNLMTNTEIIALMNCLERMGLTAEVLKSFNDDNNNNNNDGKSSTTLRFEATDSCTFLRDITLQVPEESPRVYETIETTETDIPGFSGTTTKSTISKVINNIHEYHWKVEVEWELSIYSGNNVAGRKILKNRSSSMIVVIQSSKEPPLPEHQKHDPYEVSLSWLLQQINTTALTAQFRINTQHAQTKTPYRNPQIEDALKFIKNMNEWTRQVQLYFTSFLQHSIIDRHNPAGPQTPKKKKNLKLGQISGKGIFNPVQPLMENPSTRTEDGDDDAEMTIDQKSILSLVDIAETQPEDATATTTANAGSDHTSANQELTPPVPLLSTNDMNKLLNEQIRTLDEKIDRLEMLFPGKTLAKLISAEEAVMVLMCVHIEQLNQMYSKCVKYVETMLENQLVAAIGKRVDAEDLDKFVKFHNAKLLNPAPLPFCRLVRRPDHYPDGIVSIESSHGKNEPIETFVREIKMPTSLKMPLNAAATLEFTGQTFLHGWLRHRFSQSHKSFQIAARARQFSSFMLVVGTMVGPDKLQPQDAIILQNKDEVIIPLLLEEIPSAKEFKDSIQSLSPEQQRFAKAFRGMQLESSVLGLCVIQIKPQLEKLLGLPNDSLTKEMRLTQYLMKLFVEYQVPSDLLSYDGGDAQSSVKEKVENVKSHVQAVVDVISSAQMNDWEAGAYRATAAIHQATQATFGSFGAPAPAPFGVTSSPAPSRSPFGATAAFGAPTPFGSSSSPAPSATGFSFGAAPAPSPFGFGSAPAPSGGLVGATPPLCAPNPPASLYEKLAQSRTLAPSGGGLFGSPAPAPSGGGLFGSPAPAPSGGGLFGSPAPAPAHELAATPAPQGGGLFGAPVPATATQGGTATAETSGEPLVPVPEEAVQVDAAPEPEEAQDHTYESGDVVSDMTAAAAKHEGVVNFTMIPKTLDSIVEKHDRDGALRSTVMKTINSWSRLQQPNLLTPIKKQQLMPEDIKSEKNKAFDLLDALSRSGSLPIDCSELHVIICLTHCFEKDVMGTVIEDNVNPIEKLEMSTLLLASTIHGVAPKEVVRDSKEVGRLSNFFPKLL